MTTSYGAGTVWAVVAVIGALTFAIRFSFIYLFGRIDTVPARVERALGFVPPAVLAALTIPALVTVRPGLVATVADPRFVAGAVAGVVAWKSEDVFLTVIVGMAALHAARYVL